MSVPESTSTNIQYFAYTQSNLTPNVEIVAYYSVSVVLVPYRLSQPIKFLIFRLQFGQRFID